MSSLFKLACPVCRHGKECNSGRFRKAHLSRRASVGSISLELSSIPLSDNFSGNRQNSKLAYIVGKKLSRQENTCYFEGKNSLFKKTDIPHRVKC